MKSKYESHVAPKLTLIEAWARNGVAEEQMAKNLGIAYSTFKLYKGAQSALSAVLARAREVVDAEVEGCLLKKCTGYNATIIKHYKVKDVEYDPDTGRRIRETETLIAVQDEVHVPADTKAQVFWLTNRKKDEWKANPESQDAADTNETGVVLLPPIDPDVDENAKAGGA